MVIMILYILVETVVMLASVLGCLLISYISLNYKEEIWEDIYERMGWNEDVLCIQTYQQD